MADQNPPPENSPNSQDSDDWRERQERRRQRLRSSFEESRRSRFRHEPPPNLDDPEPRPWWKIDADSIFENPLGLFLLILFIAVLLYLVWPILP